MSHCDSLYEVAVGIADTIQCSTHLASGTQADPSYISRDMSVVLDMRDYMSSIDVKVKSVLVLKQQDRPVRKIRDITGLSVQQSAQSLQSITPRCWPMSLTLLLTDRVLCEIYKHPSSYCHDTCCNCHPPCPFSCISSFLNKGFLRPISFVSCFN